MTRASTAERPTAGLQELIRVFRSLERPFGPEAIWSFTTTYKRVYPALSRTDKRHADDLVTTFIDNLKDPWPEWGTGRNG